MKQRKDPLQPRTQPPESVVKQWIVLTGLAAFYFAFYIVYKTPTMDHTTATLLLPLVYATVVGVLEIFFQQTYKAKSTGLDWSLARGINIRRVAVKILGLYITLGMCAFVFALFPEYAGSFYLPFYEMLMKTWFSLGPNLPVQTWSLFMVLAIPYFTWVDTKMERPLDAYWHLGALFLGWKDHVDLEKLTQHALGWMIKVFFFPLMYVYFHNNLTHLRFSMDEQIRQLVENDFDFMHFYRTAWDMLILVDVGCIVVGYILTVRVLDSHLRSAEPTFQGWFVALICYQPFSGLIFGAYLPYDHDSVNWQNYALLKEYSGLQVAIGIISLLFYFIYTWASLSFGLRFSNLTHRGIITNGPYRWFRHPAYIFKNIAWWFEALPFVPARGRLDAVGNIIRICMVNLIYYMRARTEERHLSKDKDYVRYALWMNEHGKLAWLGRLIPWVRYQPPNDWRGDDD